MNNNVKKCERKDCFAYCAEGFRNNCVSLRTVYENDMDCKFYKPASEVSWPKINSDCNNYALGLHG